MSFLNDHYRLSGDAMCRALAFLSIALLASALFVLSTRYLGGNSAVVERAPSQATNINLTLKGQPVQGEAAKAKGVDLMTLVGLNGYHGRLYVLSTYDRNLYKQIFKAQERNDWAQANALLKRVHDPVLVGHVLFDRYINAADYKAKHPDGAEKDEDKNQRYSNNAYHHSSFHAFTPPNLRSLRWNSAIALLISLSVKSGHKVSVKYNSE